VEIPGYQPFYIPSVDGLRAEIDRLALTIPVDENLSPLAQNLAVGGKQIPNRFCAQPIAGGDANSDGSPGELTLRRYRRYAEGRFGLIWVERTIAGEPTKPGQLALHEGTLSTFGAMVREIRAASPDQPILILQLTSDAPESLLRAALLAAEAGFDGIDLQCARETLPESLAAIQQRAPALLLTTRLCLYAAVRGGFGVSADDYRQPDLTEPIRLVRQWQKNGLALLNITAASPSLRGADRATRARSDSEIPDEHPLMTLHRQLRLAQSMREAVPNLPVVGSGWSWLRQFAPHVAAGALRAEMIDFAGLGRSALAHPTAPAEIFAKGQMDAGAVCMVCQACAQLRDEGESVGCVLRDPEVYGPIYRRMRRFDADQLLAGAHRCHLCEAAPCVAASPTRADIPAFIQAFRNGDESRAYEIIRERDPLPELTSRLAPAWLESEGACIETTLTGTPVPILDLQYAISWRARDRGQTGVRIPPTVTGRRIAIVGAGPSGLAATVRLIELGHKIDLYEQSNRLGGVPARVLAEHRHLDPQPEIDALLQPAFAAKRLHVHFGATLEKDVHWEKLRTDHAAVLLATGLWQERSLGCAHGVLGALTFLESPLSTVPDRVAILAGGDAAMDAARAVQDRGAKEIFIIFGGPRSELHWHLPESWFATPGVRAMMQWEPLGYETDQEGHVRGVRLRHAEFHLETILPVGLVIEAMELSVADGMRPSLATPARGVYTAGALINGGASVGQCVAEGLAIAETIHRDLSS
jgi:NADPH-dependent glutamate synthase beta subunit-like oxidoreductase/2,4-dienoyl-CoA reductase-like NADH-dependent reductase (Old Yellow Enzyme family)